MKLLLANFPLGLAVVVTHLSCQCSARPGAALSAKKLLCLSTIARFAKR